MSIIPFVRLIISLTVGGLLIYIFNNVIGIVYEYFPNATQYGTMISMLWHSAIFVIMIIEAIRFFMAVQKRRVYE